MVDKVRILSLLRERLDAELRSITSSQSAAQEGAVHEETRQEDPKDTRAIEAQYIARGLAERVETLREHVAALARLELTRFGPDDPVDLTALIVVEEETGRRATYFFVPVAGGERLELDGTSVLTLTPQSPLGASLMNHRLSDEVVLGRPGRQAAGRIVSLA